ncbi:hypothetical protein HKBW3S42_01104 [Candidatus Hakubella thermalkaliphila]|uniref:Transposase n=1 Tax=Candidatus Hakubella thermalkaliphila TaxID=2754717 RepID=A0A6V8PNZ6_9ACTN|nr:hypothetical protein HKBW3S42_01104 [Candidatus Hakubella thermalkaliphila]
MENNGKGSRKHLSSEKKFEIVKEVIMGKIPVSEVCKRHEDSITSGGSYFSMAL